MIILSGVHWKPKSGSIIISDHNDGIVEEWEALPQDIIFRAVNSFRQGVRIVIKKNVGHLENIFRRTSNIFIRLNL